MKNIIVFSDSHGDFSSLVEVVENERDADAFFHCGDGLDELATLEKLYTGKGYRFYGAVGNNDWKHGKNYNTSVTAEGYKILLTHGHMLGVKGGLNRLSAYAGENSFDIVFYGHTHSAKVDIINDIIFLNPGCVSSNLSWQPSYARVALGSTIETEIVDI